jgi:dienelactone hydrolase
MDVSLSGICVSGARATRCLLVGLLWLACGWAVAQTNPGVSPLPGIEIPAEDRERLAAESAGLRADIEAAAAPGGLPAALRERLVDVEIFPKAVSWAVELDEFYDLKQVAAAEALLAEGRGRLEALRSGTAPWTTATGLVVRGYRSRIDGSVQPYGLVVPEDRPAAGGRMDIWLHGRDDKLTELAFLSERMRSRGTIAPPRTLVLHPYGRFCNAFKFAGETDVLEAIEDAMRHYAIGPDHVALRGFSMGGAGSWHLGAHHASRWAVIAPGAGFVETARYAKVFVPGRTPPPEWEQVLWRLYDVPGYAVNLTNRPVIAYSGANDPQKQAADIMVEAVAAVGGRVEHLVGPDTGHGYHRETKESLDRLVDAAAERGRPAAPPRVRFATYTLRYDRLDWVRITGLMRHWEQATVDAEHRGPGILAVKTSGATALTLTPPESWAAAGTWSIDLDGQTLDCPTAADGLHFHVHDGRWQTGRPAVEPRVLRKRHGLQGPIDDAFMDGFVFVKPTGRATHPAVGAWMEAELARAIDTWRVNFRGAARIVADTDVTPDMIRDLHLVLWGDPASNAVLARILPRLPLEWNAATLRFDGRDYAAASHVPVLVYPNPLAPDRYVVLNSSYTFRQGSSNTNALQTPKLPDWAVVNLDTPPSIAAPGRIEAAGFFDEAWRFPTTASLKQR